MQHNSLKIRTARPDDAEAVRALIARSARHLGRLDYTEAQIEAALEGAWGLDTRLIEDGTMFIAMLADRVVACGAWSFRRTPFGGDGLADRDDRRADPESEPGKIRAFFVDPSHAGQGIGSLLLQRCEASARSAGFKRVELAATIPGERFYRKHGYALGSPYEYECRPGISVTILPMSKSL